MVRSMLKTDEINSDGIRGAYTQVRGDLESWRTGARQLAPHAEFALSDDAQYVYGAVTGEDLESEWGLVKYALRFANGEEDTKKRQALALPDKLRELLEQQIGLNPEGGSGPGRLEAELADHIEARRTKLRRALGNICRWHQNKQRINVQEAGSDYLLRDVWALPMLKQKPLRLASFWVIASAGAFDAFLGLLLLDDERAFGRSLRQCALERCHIFFLQPDQVGRPQQYCGPEHTKEANEGSAARRARNSRLRASAVQLLIREHGRRYAAEIKAAVRQAFKEQPNNTAEQIARRAWELVQAERKRK
jgi:hypothetical protein